MDIAFLYLQDTLVQLIIDIISDGKLEVSTNNAMSNSLSNGSIKNLLISKSLISTSKSGICQSL